MVSVVGLDLGSSYVKGVAMDETGQVTELGVTPTGGDFLEAAAVLLGKLSEKPGRIGLTGYGRHTLEDAVQRTEVACLARGLQDQGYADATLVDVGGQDCKVLTLRGGKLAGHHLNRRCAAGTGAYIEFLAFRLRLEPTRMSELAAGAASRHTLNSFCTVFAGTEVLDCLRARVPMPELLRGMYAAVAERVREIAPLAAPVLLSGGVAAHHRVFGEVFAEVTGLTPTVVASPQFLAARGAARLALEAA